VIDDVTVRHCCSVREGVTRHRRSDVLQESRAVARKPHDATTVVFGSKFVNNIHYKFKSSQASKAIASELLPHSHLTLSLGVNPLEFLDDFFIPKTRVLVLSVWEDFVILACVVFTQCQCVTDGQADGRTDG